MGTWLLLLPALMSAVGAVRWAAEARDDRRIRILLGMSPLRRRLPCWILATVWFFVSSVAVAFGIALLATARPELIDPASQQAMVIFVGIVGGGTAVVGFTQAWRRRTRDAQIEQDDLTRAELARVDPPERAPTWMPARSGTAWVEWKRCLDEPVEPGQGLIVIAVAAVIVLGLLAVAIPIGYAMITSLSPGRGGPLPVVIFLVALLVAVLNLAAPLGAGLRTAVRRLRAHK